VLCTLLLVEYVIVEGVAFVLYVHMLYVVVVENYIFFETGSFCCVNISVYHCVLYGCATQSSVLKKQVRKFYVTYTMHIIINMSTNLHTQQNIFGNKCKTPTCFGTGVSSSGS
jgi:hypothetical protein